MRKFNKIFGVGISRTGTSSLGEALQMLGILTVHWPLRMHAFCAHRAAVDITTACRYKELDQLFPNSVFIYTERAPDSWLKSVTAHYEALGDELNLPAGERQFAQEADIRIYGTIRPLECDFLAAYRKHHDDVLNYFQNQPHRLLRMNIVEGDGWKQLCDFIELTAPDSSFPHSNKSKHKKDGDQS